MLVKGIIDEDFVNYKKPSMMIAFPYCDFKCDKDCGRAVCQNGSLVKEPNIEISCESLIERYLSNNITEAIVFQGLEPCDSPADLCEFITKLRNGYGCNDDIVIYTGYERNEGKVSNLLDILTHIYGVKNMIVKFGRFIPDQKPHRDEILGVDLASDNQHAEVIS